MSRDRAADYDRVRADYHASVKRDIAAFDAEVARKTAARIAAQRSNRPRKSWVDTVANVAACVLVVLTAGAIVFVLYQFIG